MGAFGYTGRHITGRPAQDRRVRTLTRHPHPPNPFGESIRIAPFDFNNAVGLVSDSIPIGRTRRSDWLEEKRERVGARYAGELARHFP